MTNSRSTDAEPSDPHNTASTVRYGYVLWPKTMMNEAPYRTVPYRTVPYRTVHHRWNIQRGCRHAGIVTLQSIWTDTTKTKLLSSIEPRHSDCRIESIINKAADVRYCTVSPFALRTKHLSSLSFHRNKRRPAIPPRFNFHSIPIVPSCFVLPPIFPSRQCCCCCCCALFVRLFVRLLLCLTYSKPCHPTMYVVHLFI